MGNSTAIATPILDRTTVYVMNSGVLIAISLVITRAVAGDTILAAFPTQALL